MTAVSDARPSAPDRTGSPQPSGDDAPRRVDAVIFDLGSVLINWDPRPAIAATVGQEQAALFLADEDFDFAAWNYQQDAGRSWEEAEALAVASHPHWESAIRAYRANFALSMVGTIQDSVQILSELQAAGTALYALTNWSGELFPAALERFDFLGSFRDIIVSGDEGVAKPDPEIFAILQKRIGHRLDSCVFIDDSAPNVEAAAKAGLDAILFTDTGHLREDLRVRGLPLQAA